MSPNVPFFLHNFTQFLQFSRLLLTGLFLPSQYLSEQLNSPISTAGQSFPTAVPKETSLSGDVWEPVPAWKCRCFCLFPHRLSLSWGLGSHIFLFKAGKPILPAVGSKLLKAVFSSHMGIVAQPLLRSVTAERESEKKIKSICLKNIFILREICVFGGNTSPAVQLSMTWCQCRPLLVGHEWPTLQRLPIVIHWYFFLGCLLKCLFELFN